MCVLLCENNLDVFALKVNVRNTSHDCLVLLAQNFLLGCCQVDRIVCLRFKHLLTRPNKNSITEIQSLKLFA